VVKADAAEKSWDVLGIKGDIVSAISLQTTWSHAEAADNAAGLFRQLATRAWSWSTAGVSAQDIAEDIARIQGFTTAVRNEESLVSSTERNFPLTAALAWINEATHGLADLLPEVSRREVAELWATLKPHADTSYSGDTAATHFEPNDFVRASEIADRLGDTLRAINGTMTTNTQPAMSAEVARAVVRETVMYRHRSFTHGVQQGANAPFNWPSTDMLANAVALTEEASTLVDCKVALEQGGQAANVMVGTYPWEFLSIPSEVFYRLGAAADTFARMPGGDALRSAVSVATNHLLRGGREHPEPSTPDDIAAVRDVISRLHHQAKIAAAEPQLFARAMFAMAHQYDGAFVH
jgi:hypothetical protein